MKRLALVAACALVAFFALAGSAFAVTGARGTVRDIATGKPVAGAVIHYGSISAKTGTTGYYTMKLPAGTRTLRVTRSGYLATYQNARVPRSGYTGVAWYLTRAYPTNAVPARSVAVLAWNDLGMHCDQDSYKYFSVLPPYNTLHVQLFGGEGALGSGYTVSYSFAKKTDSTLHTDFWQYASSFGWNLAPNVGLTGNGLSGTMVRDSRGLGFVATGIPVTPYDDDGTWDPYGAATITVKNSGGTVVARQDVVVPVSTEMSCSNCHGQNAAVDILTKHDAANGTTLLDDANAGHPHSCSQCHADNALGAAGAPGIPSLSFAMHNFHKSIVPNTAAACYDCHPGPKTQCLRGVMARAGKTCISCHGSMATVAGSIATGRRPWLDEPKCGSCHGAAHAENSGKLYRDSVLLRSAGEDMNGRIYCEACHNGTHAEYVSRNPSDAVVPKSVQGNSYWIYNCKVCHKSGDSETAWRGQAMHR